MTELMKTQTQLTPVLCLSLSVRLSFCFSFSPPLFFPSLSLSPYQYLHLSVLYSPGCNEELGLGCEVVVVKADVGVMGKDDDAMVTSELVIMLDDGVNNDDVSSVKTETITECYTHKLYTH